TGGHGHQSQGGQRICRRDANAQQDRCRRCHAPG
ncbi:MAG: hypothetical protein, partial [Olavius algarvensis Gamma 1 endosymbiont]